MTIPMYLTVKSTVISLTSSREGVLIISISKAETYSSSQSKAEAPVYICLLKQRMKLDRDIYFQNVMGYEIDAFVQVMYKAFLVRIKAHDQS